MSFTPANSASAANPLLSVDRIIAGVESLLLRPPNFANHLGDVYERFDDVQEEHQNYISLFDVDRMLRRGTVQVPKDTKEIVFPATLSGVGSFKMVRIIPSDVRLSPVPIEIVPLENLLNYSYSYSGVNDANLPQRLPTALSWWNDGSIGRITFSDTFDQDVTITVWYEPAGKTDLNPEAEANVLQNAFSYIKAEIAMRCLDLFFVPGTSQYAARQALLQRQIESAAAILEEWLSSADEEESGFIGGWGRASNVNSRYIA